ncbi:MAG: MetQ/NlpA family ABC transporter substrate-binding protein [Oscillospiraceae bacterium]|nr:MetQ/NlpA family ABC transporter substrate-binding protein [Bacillota bacterium]
MKKLLSILLCAALVLGLAACGTAASDPTAAPESEAPATDAAETPSGELEKIVVGASSTPHAEILEAVSGELEALGYELDIKIFDDYVMPNLALADGEIDANYFQHEPYLLNFNAENGTDLVSAAAIHYEPMGIYGGSKSSLDELAEGDIIAVPNDGTNEARALLLLQDQGLITLKEGIDASTETATILDIAENPQNLEIVEMEAKNIPHSLPDVAFAVINGNYALQAGLTGNDALASESADSDAAQTYANILAVRAGEEDSAKTQALVTALTSETCRQFIEETYSGAVVPIF